MPLRWISVSNEEYVLNGFKEMFSQNDFYEFRKLLVGIKEVKKIENTALAKAMDGKYFYLNR